MAGNAPAVIRLMSESLASKIAAGEVVERPASVVKELVENALDAAAAHIAVLCEEGGRRLIRVTDDGSGIGEADAPLLLVRHATSKIRDEEDLEAITTMGFRGEALSSIAAVARLRIRTRTRESVSGVEVRAEDGEVTIVEAGCAPGTTVEVRDLFHNTPARRKFLRTAGTEFGHVMETVRRAALAHADKSFRLVHGGKTVFNCPPSSLADRVARLMGEEVLEGMGEVDARAMGPKGLDIRGIVGRPELTYPAPKALYTYINGRPVRDRTVTRAVLDGYGGLVAAGRYPAAVIFIDMPPSEVDVNVHPAKTEVRLRDGSAVYRAVRAAVERALRRGGGGGGGVLPAAPSERTRAWETRSSYRAAGRWAAPPPPPGGGAVESRKPGLPLVATGGPQGEVVNAEFLEMEFRGDLWGEFIVTQRSDAFYIIDRHGAAERVAFERLRRSLREGAVKAQMLLLPQRIETTAQERDALVAASETLDRLGFVIEPFGPSLSGGESFILKAVPALLAERDCAALVRDMAVELAAAGGSARAEAAVESVLMRAACHSVVRGAGTVTAEGARALLRDLAVTDLSGHCPHGRPVVRRFTRAEVDAFFRR